MGSTLPEFFGPLFRSAFLVNKKSLFLQKCQCIELLTVFLGCIYTVYYIVHLVFLVLNRLSNLEFRLPKKEDQVARIGVMGGGLGNSGNARKKTFFFQLTLSLKWNDIEENLSRACSEKRRALNITPTCEDRTQVESVL